MNSVTKHINRLLFEVDCVIVPGLGGFVANYHPAVLNRTTGIVEPPSKGLIFNKHLTSNDGLLAHALVETTGCSYAQANLEIEAFVASAKHELRKGQRIEIPDVGFLYQDPEENLRFQPLYSVNFLKDSFGLSPVMAQIISGKAVEKSIEQRPLLEEGIVELNRKQQQQAHTPEAEEEIPVLQSRHARRSGARKLYWAAAVLLPLAFYSIWIPARTDFLQTGRLQWSDLNPFHIAETPRYTQSPDQRAEILLTSDDTLRMPDLSHLVIEKKVYVGSDGKEYLSKAEAESTYVQRFSHVNEPAQGDYHIIAGCFLSETNAQNQVAILKGKGIEAYLFGRSNGLYRVAAGSFSQKNEALSRMNELRALGQPNVWLLNE